jgi:hypothetical protein
MAKAADADRTGEKLSKQSLLRVLLAIGGVDHGQIAQAEKA